MNSCFVDTNVLLRYIIDDIPEQGLIAEHVIDGGAWTTPEVLCEVVYVLEGIYGAKRRNAFTALEAIANVVELRPHDETLTAIKEYGETNLDFVDCMASAYNMSGERVFTFDKNLNKRMSETSAQE